MAILGALRNLSYGRANVANKMQIANDAGLPELSLLLKTTRQSEVMYMYMYVHYNCIVEFYTACTCTCNTRIDYSRVDFLVAIIFIG